MINFIIEAKIVPVISGALKRFKVFRRLLPKKTGGSINSRYCYSVWLRHLSNLIQYNNNEIPQHVAELGPGDSLGIGIASLLSGTESYYALDVIKFWEPERNLRMLDELLELFNKRSNIPDNKEFPDVTPELDDYSFPSSILTLERLYKSLSPERVYLIRKELKDPENSLNTFIKYKIPWYDPSIINEKAIDLILSQAVMEHVDDLENTYTAMKAWLKDAGYISQTVDFRSHGFTKNWNGHWTLSDFEWKIVRGGRVYAINRQPLSPHLKYLSEKKFNILKIEKLKMENIFNQNQLANNFKNLSYEDLNTSGAYFLAKNDCS